jgi:hypothetical protein
MRCATVVKLADSNSHGPKLLGFPEMDEAGSLAMAVWKATGPSRLPFFQNSAFVTFIHPEML